MSKTKNHYWKEAEDFLNSIETKVKAGTLTISQAVKTCLDAKISWSLIGFDDDYKAALESQLFDYLSGVADGDFTDF